MMVSRRTCGVAALAIVVLVFAAGPAHAVQLFTTRTMSRFDSLVNIILLRPSTYNSADAPTFTSDTRRAYVALKPLIEAVVDKLVDSPAFYYNSNLYKALMSFVTAPCDDTPLSCIRQGVFLPLAVLLTQANGNYYAAMVANGFAIHPQYSRQFDAAGPIVQKLALMLAGRNFPPNEEIYKAINEIWGMASVFGANNHQIDLSAAQHDVYYWHSAELREHARFVSLSGAGASYGLPNTLPDVYAGPITPSTAPPKVEETKRNLAPIIVGVVGGLVGITLIVVGVILYRRRRSRAVVHSTPTLPIYNQPGPDATYTYR